MVCGNVFVVCGNVVIVWFCGKVVVCGNVVVVFGYGFCGLW